MEQVVWPTNLNQMVREQKQAQNTKQELNVDSGKQALMELTVHRFKTRKVDNSAYWWATP